MNIKEYKQKYERKKLSTKICIEERKRNKTEGRNTMSLTDD